jgi:hypothetical protein
MLLPTKTEIDWLKDKARYNEYTAELGVGLGLKLAWDRIHSYLDPSRGPFDFAAIEEALNREARVHAEMRWQR